MLDLNIEKLKLFVIDGVPAAKREGICKFPKYIQARAVATPGLIVSFTMHTDPTKSPDLLPHNLLHQPPSPSVQTVTPPSQVFRLKT